MIVIRMIVFIILLPVILLSAYTINKHGKNT